MLNKYIFKINIAQANLAVTRYLLRNLPVNLAKYTQISHHNIPLYTPIYPYLT